MPLHLELGVVRNDSDLERVLPARVMHPLADAAGVWRIAGGFRSGFGLCFELHRVKLRAGITLTKTRTSTVSCRDLFRGSYKHPLWTLNPGALDWDLGCAIESSFMLNLYRCTKSRHTYPYII